MTPLDFFHELHALGVVLTPYPDGTLRYKAPKGVLTPELLIEMRQHKEGLHGLGEVFEERAALAEFCGGLSRADAEQVAWQCALDQTPAQLCVAAVPA
jgi:hypothetical protein